jgi:antitoxin component YwqK of YwqJK toxin-antitoxin module
LKHLDTAIQVVLLIVAIAGLALIGRSILVIGEVGQDFSGNNPFFIFVRVVLGLMLSIDALIGAAIFCASLVFWKKRQVQLLAQTQLSDGETAGTVLGAFTRQAGALTATAIVLALIGVISLFVTDVQRAGSKKAAEQQLFREEHPEGPFTKSYPNGQIKIQGRYDGNGLIQGAVSGWYATGQKKFELTVIDGREVPREEINVYGEFEGRALRWHENGQLESESRWINGRRDGASKSWWPDGQLKGERAYNRDGTAIWKYWFQNGQLEFEIGFVDTDLEGVVTPLMTFGTKENGLRGGRGNGHGDGIWTRWYDNGQIREKIHWSAGQKLRRTFWNLNGTKYSETTYENASPGGGTVYFDKDGNIED